MKAATRREVDSMLMDPVELSPLHARDLTLAGFLLHRRWPDNLREWAQLLTLAVRIAAVPGTVRTSAVFATRDDAPEIADTRVVGFVAREGPALGEQAPRPGSLLSPRAVMVLHPPTETVPRAPEDEGCASGCILLPGIPDLGLDHRAVWVEADAEGNVGRLVTQGSVDPRMDPDLAVMAILLAA